MLPLARIAILMWMLARPLIAAGPFDVCDQAWPEATDRTAAARCYYDQARASGRFDEGLARVEALVVEHPDEGGLRCALGFLAMASGDPTADVHFRRAVDVFAEHHDRDGELLALKSLHYVLVRQRRQEEASAVVEAARELVPRLPNVTQRAEVDLLEATHISRFGGDRVHAQALLAQAVPVLVGAASSGPLLRAAHLRASNSRHLGRRIAAEAHYQQLEVWGVAFAEPWATAAARIGFALLRFDWYKGRPTEAGRAELIALFEQALEAAERADDRATALHAHRFLGDLLRGPAADAHHRSCMELAPATDVLSRATCARSIARQVVATDPDEARRLLDQALAVDAGVEERSRALLERSILAWATESEESAWSTSLRGLDAIEALRRGQDHDGGRAGVFSLWLDSYYQLVGALLGRETTSQRDLTRAFRISERIRARVLLETMRWVEPEGDSITEGPGTACPPAGLADVQAALADDEAVLSYLLNNPRDLLGRPTGGAWLLMVTHDDERAFALPDRILDLDLRGAVVVLSACRSAGGAISSGEGVMSLARSFFQAGASAVVGGLWALDDDETASVVTLLYQGLARGETLRDALASAQRARIAAGGAAADWAGLIALGDTDRRLAGTPVVSTSLWGRNKGRVIALLVLATVAGGLRWRRQARESR